MGQGGNKHKREKKNLKLTFEKCKDMLLGILLDRFYFLLFLFFPVKACNKPYIVIAAHLGIKSKGCYLCIISLAN